MKKFLLLYTILLSAAWASADEAKLPAPKYELPISQLGKFTEIKTHKSFQSGGNIKIENLAGKVTIQGWARNEIYIHARLGEHVERLLFEVDEDDAKIEVVLPHRFKRKSKAQSEVIIYLPTQCTIEFEGVSSSISISNTEGRRHKIETVSGDIETDNVQGDLKIESVSGNVKLSLSNSNHDIETVSGDILVNGKPISVDIESVSGNINVSFLQEWASIETVSGKISVQGTSISSLDVNSHSGDISYSGGIQEEAEIDIESFSASVELLLDAPYSGDYKLQTFSGKTHIEFPTQSYGPSKNLSTSHGEGDRTIRAESFSGNIHISDNGNE